MVRVELPQHLRTLAHVGTEISVSVEGEVTQRSIIDAIEVREDAEAHRQFHPEHLRVWTSTERTAGRSRTIGAHVSPPLADA